MSANPTAAPCPICGPTCECERLIAKLKGKPVSYDAALLRYSLRKELPAMLDEMCRENGRLIEEVERLRELMAEVAEHPACPHSCREDLLDALREPMP